MTVATTANDSVEFLFARSLLMRLYLAKSITAGQFQYAEKRAREEFNKKAA